MWQPITSPRSESLSSPDPAILLVLLSNEQHKVRVTLQLTVTQSVCLGVEPLLGLMTRYLFICLKVAVLSIWGAISDERSGLSFVTVSHNSMSLVSK
jgi:hypothetical protein